jgi:hypothetical protein
MKTVVDPDEVLLQHAREVFERADPAAKQAFRRAVLPYLPELRATLAEIFATSTDPEESARAAELLAQVNAKHGGGNEA